MSRTTSAGEMRAALLVIASVLATVGALVFFLNAVTNRGDVEIRLGDDRFAAGNAESLSAGVARDGPLLFSDLAGRSRDIVVHHLGGDAEEGWVAFEARRPGTDRECFVRWDPGAAHFAEPTDCGGATFPPDGRGLPQLPVTVEDGTLVVDINAPALVDAGRGVDVDPTTTSGPITGN